MIVVLPVCEKDEHLALLNLEICSKLDGTEPYDCLIVHDVSFKFDKVVEAASKIFKSVKNLVVPMATGNMKWPLAANLMWQGTARYMSNQNDSWFWWEPDAVPLKKEWLKILNDEYIKGGKPFMGSWTQQGSHQYMAGVGIYPNSVAFYNESAFFCTNQPFDVELGRSIFNTCHRINELIHHELEPSNNLSDTQCSVIQSNCSVVYHKCKDGSLHNFMLKNKGLVNWIKTNVLNSTENTVPVTQPISTNESQITVVITNFQRPEKCKRAFDSCVKAGIKNIVVSASGCNRELSKVHSSFKTINNRVVINSINNDLGNNEMWLRGVKLAKTPWVHLLHDDDELMPEFNSIEKLLPSRSSFIVWASQQKDDGGRILNTISGFPNQSEGEYSTFQLLQWFIRNGTLPITPVTGLFQKDDLIRTLTECENINSQEFKYRPTMMIGNDLLIWLRSLERYDKYYWIPNVLTSLGYWNKSTTVEADKKLIPYYDNMRNYFINHPVAMFNVPKCTTPIFPVTNIIHCVERHIGGKEEEERKQTAYDSWDYLYKNKGVIPAHYTEYERSSNAIGEKRSLPFLKDALAYAISLSQPTDIIMFTNDDTILHPMVPEMLRKTMSNRGATMSHRCEYTSLNIDDVKKIPLFKEGTRHWGRDLFAFTVPWLRDHWDRIPDYVMGAPFWDLLLTLLIRREMRSHVMNRPEDAMHHSWESELPIGYVAHIEHSHFWDGYKPADKYNELLSRHDVMVNYQDKSFGEIVRL